MKNAIVKSPYVAAKFWETQLKHVEEGAPAEIDLYPGRHWPRRFWIFPTGWKANPNAPCQTCHPH